MTTGSNWQGYESLTPAVRAIIDEDLVHISRLLRTGDYSAVRYSATHGRIKGLGTGIFVVDASVKKYILDGLERCVQSA